MALAAEAQLVDPVHFTSELKTGKGAEAEIVFHATIDDGWHVYLMPAKAGGSMKRFAKGKNPSFAPDGRTVFYDRDGEIFMSQIMEGGE